MKSFGSNVKLFFRQKERKKDCKPYIVLQLLIEARDPKYSRWFDFYNPNEVISCRNLIEECINDTDFYDNFELKEIKQKILNEE